MTRELRTLGRWEQHGGHWVNPTWPGWYAWRGCAGWYARRRLSSPPQVIGPVAERDDLSLTLDARQRA